MIANGLLRSNSNQVAGRFLDQRERWRYLFVFVGLLLRCSAPFTVTRPQTIHGLLWDGLPMTIAFMSMVGAMIVEYIQGQVDKPPGEHCVAHSIVSERERPSPGVESQ